MAEDCTDNGSPRDQAVDQAEKIVGRSFGDRRLLCLALTHSSSADHRLASNERLEFLGDAVLGMVVCEYLFEKYPELEEGEMTKIKSAVVSRDTCAKVAQKLGLDGLMHLGKGMSTRGDIPHSLAAGVFEAVLGALYLDAGYDAARAFIRRCLQARIRHAVDSGHQQNFKSVLQQLSQQNLSQTPQYVMLDEKGPDHAKCFEICVEIGARRYASSWGRSKKHAEQQAALNALLELGFAVRDDDGEVRVRDPLAEAGAVVDDAA
jgi:ribonuclease-3